MIALEEKQEQLAASLSPQRPSILIAPSFGTPRSHSEGLGDSAKTPDASRTRPMTLYVGAGSASADRLHASSNDSASSFESRYEEIKTKKIASHIDPAAVTAAVQRSSSRGSPRSSERGVLSLQVKSLSPKSASRPVGIVTALSNDDGEDYSSIAQRNGSDDTFFQMQKRTSNRRFGRIEDFVPKQDRGYDSDGTQATFDTVKTAKINEKKSKRKSKANLKSTSKSPRDFKLQAEAFAVVGMAQVPTEQDEKSSEPRTDQGDDSHSDREGETAGKEDGEEEDGGENGGENGAEEEQKGIGGMGLLKSFSVDDSSPQMMVLVPLERDDEPLSQRKLPKPKQSSQPLSSSSFSSLPLSSPSTFPSSPSPYEADIQEQGFMLPLGGSSSSDLTDGYKYRQKEEPPDRAAAAAARALLHAPGGETDQELTRIRAKYAQKEAERQSDLQEQHSTDPGHKHSAKYNPFRYVTGIKKVAVKPHDLECQTLYVTEYMPKLLL
jgi:hypothetical protein